MSKNKEDAKYSSKKRKNIDSTYVSEIHNEGIDNKVTNNNTKSKLYSNTNGNNKINNNIQTIESNQQSTNQDVLFNDNNNNHDIYTNRDNNNTNNSDNNSVLLLEISWQKITTIFTSLFENTFAVNSKLYFDVALQKIDGATTKWCPIILLDALISLLMESNESRCNALKRKFNQYSSLHEAVCTVVSETYVLNSFNFIKRNNNYYHKEKFPIDINIIDIPDEWMTSDKFRLNSSFQLLGTKSNRKMMEIVDTLISHHIINENGIVDIIKPVVSKIYKEHFVILDPDNIVDNQGFVHLYRQNSNVINNIER